MAVVVQYVVKPNPGSDLAAVIGLAKESAALLPAKGQTEPRAFLRAPESKSPGSLGDAVLAMGQPQMIRTIAAARHRRATAELPRGVVEPAERPVAAGGI
jgi:hypothetical protein